MFDPHVKYLNSIEQWVVKRFMNQMIRIMNKYETELLTFLAKDGNVYNIVRVSKDSFVNKLEAKVTEELAKAKKPELLN
jgi:hypothetical protein